MHVQSLPSDLATSHQQIVNLQALIALREQELRSKSDEILYLKEKNARLLQKLFGRSSEKRVIASSDEKKQGVLSLEEGCTEKPEATAAPVAVKGHKRAASRPKCLEGELGSNDKFPEHLPREVTIIDDGEAAGKVILTKVTERLCVRPSQLYVEEIRRVVRKHDDGTISQPVVPETPLPRRCVDATFLVHVIIMKFLWHLPLYRQERMLKAQGIEISRDTLIRYVIAVAELLGRLYNALLQQVFEATNIFADETPVLVGKGGKGERAYTESRFWPFLGNGAIVFIFARTRAAKEIEPLLQAYKGSLQVDGYTVYESIAKRFPDIVLVFCWAHVRRKFIEAEEYYPKEAAEALRYIRALYRVEDYAAAHEGSPVQATDRLRRLRARHSTRILKLFKRWIEEQFNDERLLPKSSLGEAIGYTRTRFEGLSRFAHDPALAIDSNAIERQIRPVALGRKNWLFCASETGAEAACTLYSLIASCKLAGVDSQAYLVDVLNRISDHSQLKIKELLPQNWKPLQKIPENANPGG